MISSSQILCLFLLACPIYCLSRIDKVTLSSQTIEELSQSQLSTLNKNEEWGQPATNIIKCTNPSDRYFNAITENQSISKQFTDLQPHNFVYVTFDAAFINDAYKGQIDIDGNILAFKDNNMFASNYQCDFQSVNAPFQIPQKQSDTSQVVSFLLNHSSSSLKISIKPTFIYSTGVFGVTNMKIYLARCGSNASFDTSTKKCSCDSGYKQTDVTVLSQSYLSKGINIESKCVKQ